MSHPSPGPILRARLALLALPLSLLACEDPPARPSPSGALPAFKEAPAVPAPAPAPAPAPPSGTAMAPPPAAPPGGPQPPSGPPRKPEQLFVELGCSACHGEGRPFAPRLAEARTQPDETVAVWIIDPQKVRPGSLMPSFTGRLTTVEALSLARWIKAGNPASPGSP